VGRHQKKNWGKKTKKNKKTSSSDFLDSRGRASSPSVSTAALGEASIFPECQDSALGKERLPRVFFLHSGKNFFILSPNGAVCLGRHGTLFFPESGSSPVLRSEKMNFSECYSSPSVRLVTALGEVSLPRVQFFPESNTRERLASRVLDFWYSGKPLTLGKFRFSRSDGDKTN